MRLIRGAIDKGRSCNELGSLTIGWSWNIALYCSNYNQGSAIVHFVDNLVTLLRYLRPQKNFATKKYGDPQHSANIIKRHFEETRVNVLYWFAQCCGLNHVDYLCAELEQRIFSSKPTPRNLWWVIISQKWGNLGPEVAKNLVDSVSCHPQAVIDAKWDLAM